MVERRKKPQLLSIEGAVGVLVAVVAAVGDMNWLVRGVLVLVGLGVIVHLAWRIPRKGRQALVLKAIVATAAACALIVVTWHPIWLDFHEKYPRVAFNWPVTLSGPLSNTGNPPDVPPLNLPGPPLSRWGNVMFICPTPHSIDPVKRDEVIAQFKRNAEVYGKALGVDFVINEIPQGIRFDITARDTQGAIKMQMVQRYTVEMEATGSGIFIQFTLYWIGAFAVLSEFTLERDMGMAKMWASQTEAMGFAPGACRML